MTTSGIQPGDLGFTRGRGSFVTWGIRHGTGASYSHSFVFHELLAADATTETWRTAESWPASRKSQAGPRYRTRTVKLNAARADRRGVKVARIWCTPQEQHAVITMSGLIVAGNRPYGWGTIVALLLRGLGLPVKAFGRGVICSEHTFIASCAARAELADYLADVADCVDPGQLSEGVDALVADDRRDPGSKAA